MWFRKLKNIPFDEAVNGLDAVVCCARVQALHAPQDCIFMHLSMPQCDGIDATHRIRSLGITWTIVACTANAFVEDKSQDKLAGTTHWLNKPVLRRQLQQILQECLDFR